MNYEIIGSSSKGNCIIIDNTLMLDCGVSYSKIKSYLKDVKLIFISHGHRDHLLLSTIKSIAYNYPNIVFITGSKEVVFKLSKYVATENIWLLTPSTWWHLGLLKVKLDPLTHDVENYALHFEYKRKKGIYIVDTANVDDITAKDYDLYLIENNYQEEILQEHINNLVDENNFYYLDRVKKTHLSKKQCDSFLIENMGDNSIFQYVHLSKYNNTKDGELK